MTRIERTFSQADFDAFARLSGDDNSIHVNAELAAKSRFGRTVAHGMLLYGVLRGLVADTFPGAYQLDQELMFTAPTYADERMAFALQVLQQGDNELSLGMSVTRMDDQVVTCKGQTRLRMNIDPSQSPGILKTAASEQTFGSADKLVSHRGLAVGQQAQLSHRFSGEELCDYAGLCGMVYEQEIPEPLIGALWSCLMGVHLPGQGTMYLKQETDYLRAVPAGEMLDASVKLVRLRPEKHLADLVTLCHDSQGHCVAAGRALAYIKEVQP